eukprot:g6420.t1
MARKRRCELPRSEETNGHSKYVAEHEVGRRARILAVLNGEQHLSSTEYLRATVELLPADESQTVDVHALQRCLVSDGVCITYDII